jgi:hypothetical protein
MQSGGGRGLHTRMRSGVRFPLAVCSTRILRENCCESSPIVIDNVLGDHMGEPLNIVLKLINPNWAHALPALTF